MRAGTARLRITLRAPTRRAFSTSPRCLDKYGFIGLGQMVGLSSVFDPWMRTDRLRGSIGLTCSPLLVLN